MARNDIVGDSYNPPGTSSSDFESMKFNDIDVDELFWLNENPNGDLNNVHRKISETESMNLRTREIDEVSSNIVIYQKI